MKDWPYCACRIAFWEMIFLKTSRNNPR